MHVHGQIVYLALSLSFSSLIWTALDIGADEKCLAAKYLAHQTSSERITSEVVFVLRLIHSLIQSILELKARDDIPLLLEGKKYFKTGLN
jgi:hypothetical protein